MTQKHNLYNSEGVSGTDNPDNSLNILNSRVLTPATISDRMSFHGFQVANFDTVD